MSMFFSLLCSLLRNLLVTLGGLGLTAACIYLIARLIQKRWSSRKLTKWQILAEVIQLATKEDANWKDVIQYMWNGGKVSDTSQSHREASPTIVNGARGHSVSLPPGIPVGPDITEIEWRRLSTRSRVAQVSNGNIAYFGPKEYQQRITLLPGNFNLEISDLQREDAGDYEVIITEASGTQILRRVQLEVSDGTGTPPTTVTGTQGDSVSLHLGIPVRPDLHEVTWRRVEPQLRIASYLVEPHSVVTTRSFGEYRQRVTLRPRDFSLEIHNLQMQDSGHYQVTVTEVSGAETTEIIQLEVHEPGLLGALANAFRAVWRSLRNLFSCTR